MNIVGIITEHNPYHNGHLYHVEKARQVCGAEYVVSVMSGHFLQRGEPALFNKWARAKMAVLAGVDLVIELPVAFSARSASSFALGAVALLEATGVVTHLCFGSESGSIEELYPAARVLLNEPPAFKRLLAGFLDSGLSYPKARAKALTRYLRAEPVTDQDSGLYSSPNNILGIEYLKALLNLGSSIKPTTIKRFSAGYHDTGIGTNGIASATSIRDELRSSGGLTDKVKNVVPASTFAVMEQEITHGRGPVFLNNASKLLFYLLRSLPPSEIKQLLDVTEGLENRIVESSRRAGSLSELVETIKTKRYTWTRIQRILTYFLLGYTKAMAADFDSTGPRYIRILGMSSRGRALLRRVKKESSLPVVLRTAPYLAKDDSIASMLRFDIKATDIYTLLYPGPVVRNPGEDLRIMPVLGN